jgi:hypothetical protein
MSKYLMLISPRRAFHHAGMSISYSPVASTKSVQEAVCQGQQRITNRSTGPILTKQCQALITNIAIITVPDTLLLQHVHHTNISLAGFCSLGLRKKPAWPGPQA